MHLSHKRMSKISFPQTDMLHVSLKKNKVKHNSAVYCMMIPDVTK